MFGRIGFSYIGFIFLCCLIIPNVCWAYRKPEIPLRVKENGILLAFEKAGQAAVTALLLCCADLNIHGASVWPLWVAIALTLLYLLFWARYFTGKQTSAKLYGPFLGIPLPGATLPVAAAFLLSVYGKVIALGIAVIVLGIGHIGIHIQHLRALKSGPGSIA